MTPNRSCQEKSSMRLSRLLLLLSLFHAAIRVSAADRPNIFIAISDDVSFPHASAYGSKMVSTPAFDRVAADGVLFSNAFCPAPGCSPSRAAFLTGRHIWMIEEAGTHASYFQKKYRTFPEVLTEAGYFSGSVGKGWAPGNFKQDGRANNPAGKSWGGKGKSYVDGFRQFLADRPKGQPFCFWFGSSDAHRKYAKGSGLKKGKTLDQAEVPGFLPDHPEIRSDLLDYAFEVERFDDDCDQMLKLIEAAGELDNTLIIITSDNGMPFPRAKANCYEYGIHMPLAVSWKNRLPKGRTLDDAVGFVDLTSTIYEAAGVVPPQKFGPVGKSLMSELQSDVSGTANSSRDAVFCGRERHSSSRYNTLGYPQRAIRTKDYLYIYNFRPERWPAGTPQKFDTATYDENGHLASSKPGGLHGGYHDIDACPSLTFLIEHRDHPEFGPYLGWSVDKRPQAELFNIRKDPACLKNLVNQPDFQQVRKTLHDRLMAELRDTGDARVLNGGDIWETYPRVSGLRWFAKPDWANVDPKRVPKQTWLDERRPKKKQRD